MTEPPVQRIFCKGCSHDCTARFFYCDVIDGEWCAGCFNDTACGQGLHGEGCPTMVIEGGA